MTNNPSTPPDAPKSDQKMKGLLLQGLIGAVSLTGATAIPILVQRTLTPQPTPVVSPTPQPTVTPSTAIAPVQSQMPLANPASMPTQPETANQVNQKEIQLEQIDNDDKDDKKGHGKKKERK